MAGTTLTFLSSCDAEQAEAVLIEELVAEGMVQCLGFPGHWHAGGELSYEYWIQPPEHENDPQALELIAQMTGAAMRCDLGLHSCITDATDAHLLGGIAQHVARRTGGWVFIEFDVQPSADVFSQLEGAGRCIRFDGDAYLDAGAMAAWMAHPDYHFVR